MKILMKYILLLTCIIGLGTTAFAQKKHKKHSTVSVSKTTSNKGNNQRKKAPNKKVAKASNRSNSKSKQPKFDEAANLNSLLSNANADIKQVKTDSIPEKVVTILSAFKPQLKNVAKLGFTNATVQTDTSSITLNYQVPSQNLSFQYRPISLVPRAFKMDTLGRLKNVTSLKIGYGNYSHQYVDLNINTVDPKKNTHAIKLYNESTKGDHSLQMIRDLGFRYLGDQFINEQNHLQTQLFYQHSQRYRFGLVPNNTTLPESNFEQNFGHYGASFGWLNYNTGYSFFHINPIVQAEQFEGQPGSTNTWATMKNPMYLQFKNGNLIHLDAAYSFNQFNPTETNHQQNQVLRFDPSFEFNKFSTNFKLGASPTYVNHIYNLYPFVEFKKKLTDTNYLFIAGWNTNVINNQFASLAIMNPWIVAPTTILITTQEKRFVEIQVSAGKRLDYAINFSMNDYKNLPLFNRLMNTDRNSFGLKYQTIFEKKASTIELDANLRYQFSDKLLVLNKLKYIQFNSLLDNSKPWGILPLEVNSSFNWIPSKKWIIDGGFQYWTGATLYNEASKPYNLKNTFVLNAGFSYKITPSWSTWVKGDNLLDKPYERWGDYPSLGLQLIAGIVYSFRK